METSGILTLFWSLIKAKLHTKFLCFRLNIGVIEFPHATVEGSGDWGFEEGKRVKDKKEEIFPLPLFPFLLPPAQCPNS